MWLQFLTAGALAVLSMDARVAVAQSPAPAPPPQSDSSGLEQAINQRRDARLNNNGNRPQRERTDPLKRITDPANLQSPNPAIKTAAKIKADQDLAPQKIKAIKFLATVGCGCYPGVKDALLASLEDCVADVRYEAAMAFYKVAGNPCCHCEKTCCNAEVMGKLYEMAYGQDEQCCYKEASGRVRAAAEMALNACRSKVGPTTAPQGPGPTPPPVEVPGKKEVPRPSPLPRTSSRNPI
jgi:hypothetical protein